MTARLWNVTTAKPIGPPLTHSQSVTVVAFSPDGHIAVTGGNDKVQLWEATTAQPVGPPAEWSRRGAVRALAFVPGSRSLIVGAQDALYFSPLPLTVTGDPTAITQSVQALTGLELNADREIQALDARTWAELRARTRPGGDF
jgi:WD40 repeat protein